MSKKNQNQNMIKIHKNTAQMKDIIYLYNRTSYAKQLFTIDYSRREGSM
jgi:hypothetical protein